jgi:hypothetical protein
MRMPTSLPGLDEVSGHRWGVLAAVDVGILMATIGANIVDIAMPAKEPEETAVQCRERSAA